MREFVAFIMDEKGREIACVENAAWQTVGQNLANAAFIVRACNSHAALVAMLHDVAPLVAVLANGTLKDVDREMAKAVLPSLHALAQAKQ